MALLESLKLIHGTSPKSVRFYLNTSSGLIEPIFFDGHRGGWFKNYRLSDVLIENKEDIKCTLTCSNIYFYRMLFGVNNQVNYPFYNSYIKALLPWIDWAYNTVKNNA